MDEKVKRVEIQGQTRASAAHGIQSHRKRMGDRAFAVNGKLAGSQGSCLTSLKQEADEGDCRPQTAKQTQIRIGVLALQGDYEQHEHQLGLLGVGSKLVRLPGDLDGIDGLILPGGESTTMSILMERFSLFEPIRQFGLAKPIYGTCAGMILLSHSIENNQSEVMTLDLIDIDIERNGYGRQVYSQEADLSLSLGGKEVRMRAAFIRAPRVLRVGPQVSILGEYSDSAVLVCQGKVLASSFHSELEEDTRLLSYFLEDFVGHFEFE